MSENDNTSVASFDDDFDDLNVSSRDRKARSKSFQGDDGCNSSEDAAYDAFPRSFVFRSSVDKDVQLVQGLLERATATSRREKKLRENTGNENDPGDGGFKPRAVPDISYILRYTSHRGPDVDLLDSDEPFDIDLDSVDSAANKGKSDPANVTKTEPIIEIVTRVSTNMFNSPFGVPTRGFPPRRFGMRPGPPPSPPPLAYNDPVYQCYGEEAYSPVLERQDDQCPPLPPRKMRAIELHSTFMIVKSPHLNNAIRAVVDYYPAIILRGASINIPAPYRVLYHHREALAKYKNNQPKTHDPEYADTTAKHIDVLLNFLDKSWGQDIRDEEALHLRALPTATNDKLWMLYKPGDVVFSKCCGKWTAYVVSQFLSGAIVVGSSPLAHRIHAWKLSYSTDSFLRTMHELKVEAFRGEQAITNLSVVPARFFRGANGNEEPAAVLAEHVRLGKLAWELSKSPAYMSYEGNLATHERDDEDWSHPTNTTGFMSGRVMVDCNGIDAPVYRGDYDVRRRHRPAARPVRGTNLSLDSLPYFAARCGCDTCGAQKSERRRSPFAGFEDVRPTVDDMPANDLYFIAIHKIVEGFLLGERRWASLHTDQLREVDFDRDAFKSLVLDDEIKMTVKALVGKFASVQGRLSPWPNDFVRNKGQGRIFLLHGSPGVGKTCTAEATAELACRPLISLTAGDLGRHGQGVERCLDYFLKLGEKFGAIVLLDEADVYLERRRTSDIARNGLVSVFLRALEYYRGVLFLTTNRVETFDAAFTSRIHVALHYGPLTDEHREKIWLNSFERLERDSEGKVHVSVATREYVYDSRDVQSLKWNGREIRNALQTAVALAEAEALGDEDGMAGENSKNALHHKITVTDRHLRAVVKMSRGFKLFSAERQSRGSLDDDKDEVYREDDDDDVSDDD